jgi:hypothetical protein
MSRNIKNTIVTKKPYCKVCFDAGKPESEYTSHWVRSLPDRSGKTTITCPIILNTECRYCRKLGHTTKYCSSLKRMNKDKEKTIAKTKHAQVEKANTKIQNKFLQNHNASAFAALLDSDSETENQLKKQPEKTSIAENNFPALCAPMKVKKEEFKNNWATIAAKAPEVNIFKAVSAAKTDVTAKKQVVTKSWAEWSDSEDDEEEDDVYNRCADDDYKGFDDDCYDEFDDDNTQQMAWH